MHIALFVSNTVKIKLYINIEHIFKGERAPLVFDYFPVSPSSLFTWMDAHCDFVQNALVISCYKYNL